MNLERRTDPRPAPIGWVLALGLSLMIGLQLWPWASDGLRFVRVNYTSGAPWQLLTSQLVHLSWPHTWGNVLAFAVTLLGWHPWVKLRDQMLAMAGGLLGVATVLALDPHCAYYAGLSGALHGLWVGNALTLFADSQARHQPRTTPQHREARWERLSAICILLVIMARLGYQEAAALDVADSWFSVPVYRPAHTGGLVGGLALVALVRLGRQATPARRP